MKNPFGVWLLVMAIIFTGCTSDPSKDHLQIETQSTTPSKMSSQNSDQNESQPEPLQSGETETSMNPVDGTQLIFMPSGIFEMGADPQLGFEICMENSADCALEDFADESPPHLVDLSSYWIYRTEVTNYQYSLCVDDNACLPPALPEFFEKGE